MNKFLNIVPFMLSKKAAGSYYVDKLAGIFAVPICGKMCAWQSATVRSLAASLKTVNVNMRR